MTSHCRSIGAACNRFIALLSFSSCTAFSLLAVASLIFNLRSDRSLPCSGFLQIGFGSQCCFGLVVVCMSEVVEVLLPLCPSAPMHFVVVCSFCSWLMTSSFLLSVRCSGWNVRCFCPLASLLESVDDVSSDIDEGCLLISMRALSCVLCAIVKTLSYSPQLLATFIGLISLPPPFLIVHIVAQRVYTSLFLYTRSIV